MSVAAVAVGAAVVGTAASVYGANKAAGAQRDAANQASQTELEMFYQNRDDQKPFMDRGNAAGNRLSFLLGLPGGEGGNITQSQLFDADNGDWKPNEYLYENDDTYRSAWDQFMQTHQAQFGKAPNSSAGSNYDVGVAELRNRGFNLADYNKTRGVQNSNDPQFGSLLRNFSLSDFEKEPGYEFRLQEGMRGLNNSAAARGGILSGAALKAATKYNQNFASNEFGNAFNRDQVNKSNTYNRLAGVAGTGQTATNQVGVQGANVAQSVGNNLMSAGASRASGYVGTANAVNGAIGTGFNMYQNNQLMNQLGGGTPYQNLTFNGQPLGGTALNPAYG